jgi:hypothetical protein
MESHFLRTECLKKRLHSEIRAIKWVLIGYHGKTVRDEVPTEEFLLETSFLTVISRRTYFLAINFQKM